MQTFHQVRCLRCEHQIQRAEEIQRGETVRCPECQSVMIAQFIEEVDADAKPQRKGPQAVHDRGTGEAPQRGPVTRLTPVVWLFMFFVAAMGVGIVIWAIKLAD